MFLDHKSTINYFETNVFEKYSFLLAFAIHLDRDDRILCESISRDYLSFSTMSKPLTFTTVREARMALEFLQTHTQEEIFNDPIFKELDVLFFKIVRKFPENLIVYVSESQASRSEAELEKSIKNFGLGCVCFIRRCTRYCRSRYCSIWRF